MKINEKQLRNIIKESIKNVLKESDTLGYNQELQPGWYVCMDGNYGDVSVWVTDDLNEVMEVLDSSESDVLGPYNTEMEANEVADQETEKYGDTNGFYRSDNKLTESQLTKIIQESVKKILKETIGKMVLHYYIPRVGWNTMHVNSIEEAKPYIKDATYWDISKGNNTSEPENLVAWGGEGGYWSNYINKPSLATEKNWAQPSQRIIDLILSKKVD